MSLEISQGVHDRYAEAEVLQTQAEIHLAAGRFPAALDRAGLALAIEESLADRSKVAKAHQLRGLAHRGRGELAEARTDLEAAREIWARTGDAPAVRDTLGHLAEVYEGLGMAEPAAAARAERAAG